MKLLQTLDEPVQGYWDGGPKQSFEWSIYPGGGSDERGEYVRIGSWEGNHWFHVARGKTEKLTLSYAMRHLKASTRYPSKFEYIN